MAIDVGDLQAIAPYLKVLERLDRYQRAGATKPVYDAAARERLFAKMSRIADRLEAKARKGAGQGAPDPIGGAVIRGGRGMRQCDPDSRVSL